MSCEVSAKALSMSRLASTAKSSAALDSRHTFMEHEGFTFGFFNLLLRGVFTQQSQDQEAAPTAGAGHNGWQVRGMRYIRALFFLFNIQSIIMATIAMVAVYVTGPTVLNYRFSFDFSIIAFGTVTPLMFLIRVAYDRRERALVCVAALKGALMNCYFCHRDWDLTVSGIAERKGNNESPGALAFRKLLIEFGTSVRRFLLHSSIYESVAEIRMMTRCRNVVNVLTMMRSDLGGNKVPHKFRRRLAQLEHASGSQQLFMDCYRKISAISIANELLTARAGYSKAGEGGMSRISEYQRQIITQLEALRMIHDYHTPVMLRYTVVLLIGMCSIIVAPYFNTYCIPQWTDDGHASYTCPAGYVGAITFVLILMTLYNVQADLEHPFLQISMDDVFFEMPQELTDIFNTLSQDQRDQEQAANRCSSDFALVDDALRWSIGEPLPYLEPRASEHVIIDMSGVPSASPTPR